MLNVLTRHLLQGESMLGPMNQNGMEILMHENISKLRTLQQTGAYDQALELISTFSDDSSQEFIVIAGIISILSGEGASRGDIEKAIVIHHDNPEWAMDRALGFLLLGQASEAKSILDELIATGYETAVAYGRLGATLLQLNDLTGALAAFQEAVNREPGRAEWHNNLGGILVRQQKLDEALENYEIALRIKADFPQATASRLRVLEALQRSGEVVEELEKVFASDPDDHKVRIQYARALEQDGQPGRAMGLLREGFIPPDEIHDDQCAPQRELRQVLVSMLMGKSAYFPAVRLLEQIEGIIPSPGPVIALQAQCWVELGKQDKARDNIDDALAVAPDNPGVLSTIASVHCELGEYDRAEAILSDLLETYPGNTAMMIQLGQTLMWTGKMDEAVSWFEKASKINPMALANMVDVRKMPEDETSIRTMEHLADNPLLGKSARAGMGFALAKVHDKQKDYDRAFQYLAQANEFIDRDLRYDAKGFSQKIDLVRQVFTRDFFAKLSPIRRGNRIPVFVVGMPRSGTTLTEQILCSHPDIFGAGELPYISKLTALLPRVLKNRYHFPVCVPAMNPHLREEGARYYLHQLDLLDPDNHLFVVDKMPHNFVNVGLIAMIFPGAKIIHIRRDPRDTAMSNFQQNFKARNGGLGYAFDLEKTALQINDYHRMMQHWREVLPLEVFEIKYEDLVGDQDYWSHKLLEFAGVDWDEQVMDFHKTERAVRTASVTQVRQPIYQTSKQKWRRYEKYLKPLLDNLDPTYMPEEYKE